MNNIDEQILETLKDIRDLLRLSAQPTLDAALAEIRRLVSTSDKKLTAVVLMDGTKSQSEIAKVSAYDKSDLSKLVKQLTDLGVLSSSSVNPKLLIPVTTQILRSKNNGRQEFEK
jgi:predicted transcriptional regulator